MYNWILVSILLAVQVMLHLIWDYLSKCLQSYWIRGPERNVFCPFPPLMLPDRLSSYSILISSPLAIFPHSLQRSQSHTVLFCFLTKIHKEETHFSCLFQPQWISSPHILIPTYAILFYLLIPPCPAPIWDTSHASLGDRFAELLCWICLELPDQFFLIPWKPHDLNNSPIIRWKHLN